MSKLLTLITVNRMTQNV